MKKIIILFALFFCATQTNAQTNDTAFATLNVLIQYAKDLQINPNFGKPFKDFLKDTSRVKQRIRNLQKYLYTDTFPVVCILIHFPIFGIKNAPSVQYSRKRLISFFDKQEKSIVGINKFYKLSLVTQDSMYNYYYERVGPTFKGYSFNQVFSEYSSDDALLLIAERKKHDLYGIGDSKMNDFKHTIAPLCLQYPQVGKILIPLIDLVQLQLELSNCLDLVKKYPRQKVYLPVASAYQPYVDWIARSLQTGIPMGVFYSN